MRKLREQYRALEKDLLDTIKAAAQGASNEHYGDLRAVETLIRKYDIKLRGIPLDREEVEEPPPVCVVCGEKLGSSVMTAHRQRPDEEFYAHPECVNKPRPRPASAP